MLHVLALASVLLVVALGSADAQVPFVRLKIGATVPTFDSAMRVQVSACDGMRCLVAFGGMRDSADAVAWPTIYWSRFVDGVADTIVRMLPEWARPNGVLAVSPDADGFLLLWTDTRDGDPAIFGLRLDSLGAAKADPWLVADGSFGSLRLFDGRLGHLVVAGISDTTAVAMRVRARTTIVLDTIASGARSVWRAHGFGNSIALPTASDATAPIELRDIDTWESLGTSPAARFARAHRFETDGGLWTVLDSSLAYFARFDDEVPVRSISTRDISTGFRDALWLAKRADTAMTVAYVRLGELLAVHVYRRDVQGDTLGPEIIDTTLRFYKNTPTSVNFWLQSWTFVGVGVRSPVLRFEYSYYAYFGGDQVSGTVGASVVVGPTGRGYVAPDMGAWSAVDAGFDGMPFRLSRVSAVGSETIGLRTVAPPRVTSVASPIALTRVATKQYAPVVTRGDSGFTVVWIEDAPNVSRAATAARWDGVADTVRANASISESRYERGNEYRQERSVGHWRYPGASLVTNIWTEVNRPYRPSHPAWDKASWSAHRGNPRAAWDSESVGGFEVPYMSYRPPIPAGGSYFCTSSYDPTRDEIVVLAARGLDDLVMFGMAATPERTWRFTLPLMAPDAIVPVDSGVVLAIFGDSLVRVSAGGASNGSVRLETPIRRGDVIQRQLGESFLHLRIDSTTGTLRRYSLDGALQGIVRLRMPVRLVGTMLAQRPGDSAIAIVSSADSAIHLTLLDRKLGLRIEDSVIVRSDGDVRAPQASFIDGELVVAWEDAISGQTDIAVARATVEEAPAAIESDSRHSPTTSSVGRLIRNARIEVALVPGAPTTIDMLDLRGRSIVHRLEEVPGARLVLDVGAVPAGVYVLRIARAGELRFERVVIAR